MLNIRFVPIARREFDDARDWYEQRQKGLGQRFEAVVHAKLLSIREHPELYAVSHNGLREASVGKFPYTIYFRVDIDEIIIASVFHNSRNPEVWQSRLDDE